MPIFIGRRAREAAAALRTLRALGYTWTDGQERWIPPRIAPGSPWKALEPMLEQMGREAGVVTKERRA